MTEQEASEALARIIDSARNRGSKALYLTDIKTGESVGYIDLINGGFHRWDNLNDDDEAE